jgi:hypothetical protein
VTAGGLLATKRLIPRAQQAGNFSRTSRTRPLNIAFASISIECYSVLLSATQCYSVQLGLAIALLTDTRNTVLQHALVLLLVALYGSAIARAWEVSGITRRR